MFKYAWTIAPASQLREGTSTQEEGVFSLMERESQKNWKAIPLKGSWYKKVNLPSPDPTSPPAIPSAELPPPTPPSVRVIHQPDPTPVASLQASLPPAFISKRITPPDIRLQLSRYTNDGIRFGSSSFSRSNRPQKRR